MNVKDYIISISKERVAELPTMAYPAAITVVDSAAVAHSALRVLAKEKYIGFDTETRPAFRKGLKHKVALMQLSTDERCFLFRLNKIKSTLYFSANAYPRASALPTGRQTLSPRLSRTMRLSTPGPV